MTARRWACWAFGSAMEADLPVAEAYWRWQIELSGDEATPCEDPRVEVTALIDYGAGRTPIRLGSRITGWVE